MTERAFRNAMSPHLADKTVIAACPEIEVAAGLDRYFSATLGKKS
jgi:hypothetical protein